MHSNAYTLRFAATVSVVASVLVAGSAVSLADRQEANRVLDRRRNVLAVAGLVEPGERLTRAQVTERFRRGVRPVVIELATGAPDPAVDPERFDQRSAARDPATSAAAPENTAGVRRLPTHVTVYQVLDGDTVRSLVLPVEGSGLWATMYGFIALSGDLRRVEGIAFYEHKETPGLGAEIENARWRARWADRRPFDDAWRPRVEVVKGPAPPPDRAPFEVDGLAGATLTGRGVTNLVRFWLGPDGFGPYLEAYRRERGIS